MCTTVGPGTRSRNDIASANQLCIICIKMVKIKRYIVAIGKSSKSEMQKLHLQTAQYDN